VLIKRLGRVFPIREINGLVRWEKEGVGLIDEREESIQGGAAQ
jgi:hypothetical protein